MWSRRIAVPVVTLDHLIDERGVSVFVKIDVEGAERRVLAGLSPCGRVTLVRVHDAPTRDRARLHRCSWAPRPLRLQRKLRRGVAPGIRGLARAAGDGRLARLVAAVGECAGRARAADRLGCEAADHGAARPRNVPAVGRSRACRIRTPRPGRQSPPSDAAKALPPAPSTRSEANGPAVGTAFMLRRSPPMTERHSSRSANQKVQNAPKSGQFGIAQEGNGAYTPRGAGQSDHRRDRRAPARSTSPWPRSRGAPACPRRSRTTTSAARNRSSWPRCATS